MGPLLLIILLFAVAWVVLILPKQRELKRHNALVASLEVGDEVMTGSGFYGTVTDVADDKVRIRLAPEIEVTLARRAVVAKIVDPAPGAVPIQEPEPVEITATPDVDGDADVAPDTTADAELADADEDLDR